MCIERQLNELLSSENEKWSPSSIKFCGSSECQEQAKVLLAFADYIHTNLKPSVDAETLTPASEEHMPREYSYFCELMKILEQEGMGREEKVRLIGKPKRKRVLIFLQELVKFCQVSTEVIIVSFIYFKRLLKTSQWTLRSASWRSMLLTAMRLAQRSEGSPSLSLADMNMIYPLLDPRDFLKLERLFLRIVDFRLYIGTAEFAGEFQAMMETASELSSCLQEILKKK